MWIERMRELLLSRQAPLLVQDNRAGLSLLAASMLTDTGETYWLDFLDADLPQLRRKSWGLPVQSPIPDLKGALAVHQEMLGSTGRPVAIILSAERARDDVRDLLHNSAATDHRILISAEGYFIQQLVQDFPELEWIPSHQLCVAADDVLNQFGENSTRGRVLLARLSDGEMVTFDELLEAVETSIGLRDSQIRTPRHFNDVPACITPSQSSQLDILVRNRNWSRAIDYCLATGVGELEELIDKAGEEALERNELSQLSRRLRSLPPDARNSESVFYWQLVAGISVFDISKIRAEVVAHLQLNEASRLRALAHMLGLVELNNDPIVTGDSFLEDPALGMYQAHLLAFSSSPARAADHLRLLVKYFEKEDRKYRMAQTILILSNALVLDGQYREAARWARRAGALIEELSLGEYETAIWTGTAAYSNLLIGKLEEAGNFLIRNRAPESMLGRPYIEGIVSTIGDFFFVQGHYETARKWYGKVLTKSLGYSKYLVLPELVIVLCHLGQQSEAEELVSMARIEVSPAEPVFAWVQLAEAILLGETDPETSEGMLVALVDSSKITLLKARAMLRLALLLINQGRDTERNELLARESACVKELGFSGWVLLAGGRELGQIIKQTYEQQQTKLTVRFLSQQSEWEYLENRSADYPGMRLKELILVLILAPQGLTGEQLATRAGWDQKTLSNVRAHIKRLKSLVPLQNKPYRLAVPVEADVVDLLAALDRADIDSALELFTGQLLPGSDAPFVHDLVHEIEENLYRLLRQRGTPEDLARFALTIGDDLQLTEEALSGLSEESELHRQLLNQVQRISSKWIRDD